MRRLLLFVLLLGVAPGAALAGEPPGDLLMERLGPKEGLPGETPRALAVGPPGLLYVGTGVGVSVCDGDRITAIEPPESMPASLTSALLYADGVLYVASQTGVWRMRDGRVEPLRELTVDDTHAQWTEGPDGAIWLAGPHGVWRLQGDTLVSERAGAHRAVAVQAGETWVGGLAGLSRLGDAQPLSELTVRRLLALPGERGLALGSETGLYILKGGVLRQLSDCFTTDLALWDGRLIASTARGLLLVSDDDQTAALRHGAGGSGIFVRVVADQDGQIWAGELGRGLVRVAEPGVRWWDPGDQDDPESSDKLLALVKYKDGLLATSQGWSVALRGDLSVEEAMPLGDWYSSVAPAGDGWLVSDNDNRVLMLDADGAVVNTILESAEAGERFMRGTDDTVWVPGAQGTWRIWPQPSLVAPLGPRTTAARTTVGFDGSLLALGPEGLMEWSAEGYTRVADAPPGCGVGFGAIRAPHGTVGLCEQSAWLLSEDGTWSSIQGSVPRTEVGLLMVLGEEVWAAGLNGLTRLWPDPQSFGASHGLPDGPYNRFAWNRVGEWLALVQDEEVVLIDRDRLTRPRPAPRPRILAREKLTGDRAVSVETDADLVPGDSFLRLRLGEDSLRPSRTMDWRFRMDGGPWSDPQNSPLLNLPGVPPGRHAVEAQVRAARGAWSEPAQWAFRLPPRWYERRDVQFGFVLGLVLILASFLIERQRRLRGEINMLREREEFVRVFGRFVAPEVAEEVLAGGLPAKGEEREISVIFADLRGFTPLTESLPAEELVVYLNRWLTAMVEEIEREGGIVNKFLGDAVVAIFGAPRPQPDHAARAVRAGIAMARRTGELGDGLSAGVGVNTGRAIAGPIGAESRMEYTVIGEAVNVAARVEALTRALDADVLVTEATRAAMSVHDSPADAGLTDAGRHPLKGVAGEVWVWRWDRLLQTGDGSD